VLISMFIRSRPDQQSTAPMSARRRFCGKRRRFCGNLHLPPASSTLPASPLLPPSQPLPPEPRYDTVIVAQNAGKRGGVGNTAHALKYDL